MNPRTRLTSALLSLGLASFLAAACDDSSEQRKPGPAAAQPAPAAAKPAPAEKTAPAGPTAIAAPPPAAPKDASAIVRAYSGCYDECLSGKVTGTNRETCKLNCDSVAEAALDGLSPAPPKDEFKKVLEKFNGCATSCYEDKTLNATNRSTCILTCQDAAEVSATAPPKASP